MTCRDCIKEDVCRFNDGINIWCKGDCPRFKNKSKYIELPCKVGDKIYQTDGIRIFESTITNLVFDTPNISFDETAIGTNIFLTKEEAEAKLKELSDNA